MGPAPLVSEEGDHENGGGPIPVALPVSTLGMGLLWMGWSSSTTGSSTSL